jgi:non-homologous end joining protein Ku
MDMIRRKAGGEVVAAKSPPAKPATRPKDLTEVLRASLEHVKSKRGKSDRSNADS